MYYPYFRGKQNELLTIRECAPLMVQNQFVPIIEPVKESLGGLSKTLSSLIDIGGQAVVIVNPRYGDHSRNGDGIVELVNKDFEQENVSVGILLTENISANDALKYCNEYSERHITLIHAGFTEAKVLAELLGWPACEMRHVFFEESCGKLYQKHFRTGERILLRDGFEKQSNRLYPHVEFFSDLHATFMDEGMNGFGDFLIVGDDYSETGGPAYAVAIHLTFIDRNKDDGMYIHHFKSNRQNDPTDPAGKFAEALDKLVKEVNRPDTQIFRSDAVGEFLKLHKMKHFPGLGPVKKLSMKHHIETLADYFIRAHSVV
jgi:hypothetical protein